jgi:hypothetical protein
MDPVSFDDQAYSSVQRTRAAHEPFSIIGLLTKRGFSPATANIVLVIAALAIFALAAWVYYANTPHKLSGSDVPPLPPVPAHTQAR